MRSFALGALITLVWVMAQPALPAPGILLMLIVFVGLIAIRWPIIRSALLGGILALLTLTGALFELSASQLHGSQVSVDTRLRVKIASVPSRDSRRLRFTADVIDCLSCKRAWGPERLQLSWYGHAPQVQAGEIWELSARVKPLVGLRNPGGFDLVRWSLAKGLHARGYVRNKPAAFLVEAAERGNLSSVREKWARQLAQTEGADEKTALVQALTLGIKDRVESSTWSLLRDTGTSHLLAISGLHISLMAGWGYLCGSCIARVVRRLLFSVPVVNQVDVHRTGLTISMLLACAYAAMAGFELPVQRTLIMLSVWVVSSWRFRTLPPATGLAVALLVVLWHNVLSILSVGFWLSFGAVATLFYLNHGHQRRSKPSPEGRNAQSGDLADSVWIHYAQRLISAIRMHVQLGLVLLPMTAWFFQSGSLIAPLANLLAVPWVGFVVVPLCFVSVLASQLIPTLSIPILIVTQWSLDLLLFCLSWMATTFNGAVSVSIPGSTAMFLCLAGLLVGFAPRGLGLRWLSIPLVLPVLLFNLWRTPLHGFEVHVLDVGQGLATLVYTDEHTVLFDTGGKVSASLSQFEAVVMPFLHASGRRRIDTLVVSHGDEDHAFGVSDVVRRFPDVRIMSSVNLTTTGSNPTTLCAAGDSWQLGQVNFSFLHPASHDVGSENDRSCVLLVHYGASRVLLTGDIEKTGEQALERRMEPLPMDLLIAPHHGSKTSSSARFIELFLPRHVVFAAGYRNAYGFPHADVQLRYTLLGARLHVTGQAGAISFAFSRSGLLEEPTTWWHSHRRFWHGIVNPACSELFSGQSLLLRMLRLAHLGKALCGK